jgi:Isochorismatase family
LQRVTGSALVVVDVQKAFDDAGFWGPRNNPACEENIARLISAWRDAGQPLVFVRHDSREPGSPLAAGAPGNAFKDVVAGEPTLLVSKSVHSVFHGDPDLAAWLRGEGIERVDLADPDGGTIGADELARITRANLDPEFCRVVTTAEAIASLEPAVNVSSR